MKCLPYKETSHPEGVFSWEKREVASQGGGEKRGGKATVDVTTSLKSARETSLVILVNQRRGKHN